MLSMDHVPQEHLRLGGFDSGRKSSQYDSVESVETEGIRADGGDETTRPRRHSVLRSQSSGTQENRPASISSGHTEDAEARHLRLAQPAPITRRRSGCLRRRLFWFVFSAEQSRLQRHVLLPPEESQRRLPESAAGQVGPVASFRFRPIQRQVHSGCNAQKWPRPLSFKATQQLFPSLPLPPFHPSSLPPSLPPSFPPFENKWNHGGREETGRIRQADSQLRIETWISGRGSLNRLNEQVKCHLTGETISLWSRGLCFKPGVFFLLN